MRIDIELVGRKRACLSIGKEVTDFDMAPKTFARRVESLRQERGWSQNQLAARAGLRAADLSRILSGTRNLLSHHVARLAAALEISVAELIERTGIDVDLSVGVPQDALMQSELTRSSIEAQLESHRTLAAEVLSDLEKAHELLDDGAGREAAAKLAKVFGALAKVGEASKVAAKRTKVSAAKPPAQARNVRTSVRPATRGASVKNGRSEVVGAQKVSKISQ